MWRSKRKAEDEQENEDNDSESEVIVRVYKNSLYYRGEIKEPNATDFCIKLRELSDKYHDTDQNIIVHLTTEGGDIFSGLTMYECLKNSNVPVNIIAEGCVCSAGTIIMLGAAKRSMYKTSVILVHSLSSWMMGMQKPKEIREELQNSETLLNIMSEVYRTNTKLPKSALKKLYDTDLYMRHDECVKLGFVDFVL